MKKDIEEENKKFYTDENLSKISKTALEQEKNLLIRKAQDPNESKALIGERLRLVNKYLKMK